MMSGQLIASCRQSANFAGHYMSAATINETKVNVSYPAYKPHTHHLWGCEL